MVLRRRKRREKNKERVKRWLIERDKMGKEKK